MPEAHDAPAIAPGTRVTLHFSLALSDGTEIDSNYDREAASFVMGDGSLLPGFEEALAGYVAGDRIRIRLPEEQAFGPVNPDNVQTFARDRFARLIASSPEPVQPGTVLAFADGAGNDIPGVVQSIDDTLMVVDFNHPLAGREIDFSADIISVMPAGVQAVEVR
ncbi:MAG: peptidylprolyl isomerase [Pseudohongiellaceae bacterium]